MKGIAYGVGVGPGDPELMTLKAIRLIKENNIIALPGEDPQQSVAYQIAVQAVPELAAKELVPIYMPMTHDAKALHESHRYGAGLIEQYLDEGKNVVFLTLGDVSIFCTFTYLQAILEEDGYQTELTSGIPSFCAAAARLGIPISEWNEPVHIIPAMHKLDETLPEGTCIIMKSGSHMKDVKEMLRASGKCVYMAENCGMPGEKLYHDLVDIPDDSSYFSLIIAKDKE